MSQLLSRWNRPASRLLQFLILHFVILSILFILSRFSSKIVMDALSCRPGAPPGVR